MPEPINGTASRPSLTERLRRRIPWSDWERTGALDQLVDSFKAMRELSLDAEEQHRATCDAHADHEIVYSMDGESIDRLILALEDVQGRVRWFQRQRFYMVLWAGLLFVLSVTNFSFVVADVVALVW